MIPEVFADMINIASVMDLSPADRAFKAIQEPLTGSIRRCQIRVLSLHGTILTPDTRASNRGGEDSESQVIVVRMD